MRTSDRLASQRGVGLALALRTWVHERRGAVGLRPLRRAPARWVDDPDQRDHAAEDHEAAADAEPDAVGTHRPRLDRAIELRMPGHAARQRAVLDLAHRRAFRRR